MGKTYFHDWHVLIIWQETVKEEKLDLKVTSDNSNNDDLLCQTKPWQTQKLLDPLFHHETEISNVVFYATSSCVTGGGGVRGAVAGGHLV